MQPTCTACQSSDFFLRYKGSAVGLYCLRCEKWQKWVGKADVKKMNARGFKIYQENAVPPELMNQVEAPPAPSQYDELPNFDDNEPVRDDDTGFVSYSHTPPPQQHNSHSQFEDKLCRTCATGSVDLLGEKQPTTSVSVFENTMNIWINNRTTLLGSIQLNYCPECGKSLG